LPKGISEWIFFLPQPLFRHSRASGNPGPGHIGLILLRFAVHATLDPRIRGDDDSCESPWEILKILFGNGYILKTAVEGLYFGFFFGGRGCPPSMKRLFWGRKNAHFQGEKAVPGTANLPIGTVKSP